MIKKVFGFLFLLLFTHAAYAQSAKTVWVDSVLASMQLDEKIGQIFMVPVSANIDARAIHEIENKIKSHEVGGLIFKNIGPVRQVTLVNHFQRLSKVPLLIAQESELSALLDSTIVFPPQSVLGAIENDTLLYHLGSLMGGHLRMLGVNVMFLPDTRVAESSPTALFTPNSFGADKMRVTQKSLALMRGIQDHGIVSAAKFFPLQQVTTENPKKGVSLYQGVEDSVQRYTYQTLIDHGLKGVLPQTIARTKFTPDKKTTFSPATLSAMYAAGWLENNLAFNGISFINISEMQNYYRKRKDGDDEVFAFKKGNDVLMYPEKTGAAIRKLKKLIRKDDQYLKHLDESVRKILEAKFEAGLWKEGQLSTDNIVMRLNNPDAKLLNQKLYQSAVTVLQDKNNTLPVKILENKTFAYVSGSSAPHHYTFYEYLKKYVDVKYFVLEDKTDQNTLQRELQNYNVIVFGAFPETQDNTISRFNSITSTLDHQPQVIVCDFGHPTLLRSANQYPAVITAYTDVVESLKTVPQIIFGGLGSKGQLPFSISTELAVGTGIKTTALNRLTYSIPEDAKMNSGILKEIDSIAAEAIRIHATPGAQVIVARHGKVIYEKNFGHLTYEGKEPVTSETLYDLASVTKVAATLQTAMFMQERGLIDLYKKVSYYLPELKKTNKKDITVLDMLTHQSGLAPFLLMYPQTMKDTSYLPEYYSRVKNEQYPLMVGEKLYASTALKDSVWSWLVKSKMTDKIARTPYTYKYSDLGFLITQRLAENILNQPLDEFVQQNLYEPLGAHSLGFNPLNRYPKHTIAPTEDDKIYRRSFVSGTVHDERAAMMGGVAGHAGLFGTAADLTKWAQMLLQKGSYGGVRYYKPETVQLFTARKFQTSRRGIGWDKPTPSDPNGPTSLYASPATFGHTGFTGTCVWVDPEFDLVYIFLSNRVYPDRSSKLINTNIRSRIQDVIYKSIFGYVEQEKPSYIATGYAINAAPARP